MAITKEEFLEIAREHTFFTSRIGSKAYGTNHPDSDDDIRCVFAAPAKLMASPFETINLSMIKDPSEDDTVYWELGSFLQKAPMDPDMLASLFARPELQKARVNSTAVRILLENRERLLSKTLIFRLIGHAERDLKYMGREDKLRDIKEKPCPLAFMFSDKGNETPFFEGKAPKGRLTRLANPSSKGWGVLKFFEADEDLLNEHGDLIIKKSEPKSHPEATEIHFNERGFSQALRTYRDRLQGPARESKRHDLFNRYGFDTKQAGSAIRLSRMALELAETGSFNLFRPDAEELKSIILDGAWDIDRVREEAARLKKRATEMAPDSPLPDQPDFGLIERIYHQLVDLIQPDHKPAASKSLSHSM